MRRRRGKPQAAVAVALGLLLTGCSEVKETGGDPYQPSEVEDVGTLGLKQVTFTLEGAQQVELQTSTAVRIGRQTVVDYAALIYDDKGATWVYTAPKPLTYLRASVAVDRIEGDRVFLSSGPPVGTKVVTVGATEVYGAELDIAGGH